MRDYPCETTAASIWLTAAIGVLAGVGFYSAVFIGTIFALVVVLAFRWIEIAIPTLAYAHLTLRFRRDETMPEADLQGLIAGQGFTVANMSYSADREANFFEYSMTIRTPSKENMHRLSNILSDMEPLKEFQIHQTGD